MVFLDHIYKKTSRLNDILVQLKNIAYLNVFLQRFTLAKGFSAITRDYFDFVIFPYAFQGALDYACEFL